MKFTNYSINDIIIPNKVRFSTNDISKIFFYMTKLRTCEFPTDNITNMYRAFSYCYNLKSTPVCGDNVINMSQAYESC
jgi:hypothetical protein